MVVAPLSAHADGRERIAVLVLPSSEEDRALANNLTEIVISVLADAGGYELVGTPELRRALGREGNDRIPTDCLLQPACLSRVGLIAGVRRLVGGNVRSEPGRYLLTLQLTDIESGRSERTFYRAVKGPVDVLIRAAQDGVEELFRPVVPPSQLRIESDPPGAGVIVDEQPRGTTPLLVSPIDPGAHRVRIEMDGRFPLNRELAVASGQSALVIVRRDELEARRRWAPYVAYGSSGGALLSFAAAAFFGTLATADPSGATRGDQQRDLEQRIGYANLANTLIVAGSILAVASLYTFVRYRRDVFGE
jgi:hypothetical protein